MSGTIKAGRHSLRAVRKLEVVNENYLSQGAVHGSDQRRGRDVSRIRHPITTGWTLCHGADDVSTCAARPVLRAFAPGRCPGCFDRALACAHLFEYRAQPRAPVITGLSGVKPGRAAPWTA